MTHDPGRLRRAEFPWADRDAVAYLNHASTGPLPHRTVDALARFGALRAEPHRISHEMQFGTLDRARACAARLIGAETAEVALMVNTGYGINLAARALPLKPGDVIVAPDREFPANVYPWMARRADGIRFELIPCRDGFPDEEALLRVIARPEVRVCAVSWVSFASGCRVDLARLGEACRAAGTFLVVDAIQGLGALALDVRETPVDIIACGAQKWLLGPWGTGFLYVRRGLLETLAPVDVSWMATRASENFERLLDYDPTFLDDSRRFEMITLPFQDFVGMAESLELLYTVGAGGRTHIARLSDRIVEWALAHPSVRLLTPAEPSRRAGIVSLAPRDPSAASRRLNDAHVVHSLREGAIRLSPHCYTTAGDVDRALDVLAGS